MAKRNNSPTRADPDLQRLRKRVARLEKERAEYSRYEKQCVVLARLSQRLTAVTSERSLMEVVCEETDELFGWEFCFLAHCPPRQSQVRVVSFVDTVNGRKQVFPGGSQAASTFSRPVREVLKGKSLLINRTPEDGGPPMRLVATCRPSASLMLAPVRCAKRTIGLLTVQSYTSGRYGPADLKLLEQITDIISPALERVYAEDELHKAHEELEIRVRKRTSELKTVNEQLRRETRERKAALEAMQESEARFRAVTEHSLSGVYVYGQGRLLYVNSAFAAILGRERDELTSSDALKFVHPDDRPILEEKIRRQVEGELDRDKALFRAVHKDGQIVLCEILGRSTQYNGQKVILGNMVDVTARVRSQEALRRSERSLRRLTVEMDRQLESERTRIARELHDGLGQVLTALNMNLAWFDKRTPHDDPAIKARVNESIAYVRQMTAMIRSLCKSLHPVVLDHHGLVEAIRSQVAEFEQYSRIHCELTVRPDDLEVDKPLAIAAFRILQEALTNVARHSRAKRCHVSISRDGQDLAIVVHDEGIGASPGRLSGTRSLGILGMKERTAAVGGVFQIENAPKGGLRVTARLPLVPPQRKIKTSVRRRSSGANGSKPKSDAARLRRK